MKKKIISIFLTFFLLFNFSAVHVFASSQTSTAGDGVLENTYYGMYDSNILLFASVIKTLPFRNESDSSIWASIVNSCNILSTSAGNATAGYGLLFKYARQSLRSSTDCDNYLKSLYTDNGNNSFDISSSAQDDLEEENNNIDFVYGIIPGSQYINPDWFNDSRQYWTLKNLIDANPEYTFIYELPNSSYGMVIRATKIQPYAGIKPRESFGDWTVYTDIYNEYWQQNLTNVDDNYLFLLVWGEDDGTNIKLQTPTQSVNGFGGEGWETIYNGNPANVSNVDLDDYNNLEYIQSINGWGGFSSSTYVYPDVSTLDSLYNSTGLPWETYFRKSNTQIPIFSSLSDLKKGTVGKDAGSVLPTFGSSVLPTVTVSQVQQATPIINNYLSDNSNNNPSGGGNNNNNNNDDPSSGSFWDKLGSLVSGLLGFIVDVLNSALEAITNVFDSIKGFFSGAVDLVGSGFSDLMGAFFPYIPSEWITIVGLCLGLSVFFFILKHFL